MIVNKKVNGNELVMELEGELNSITSPELEKELHDSVSGVTLLVFDLEKLGYLSSAGLRVLLTAQKTMNKQGKMVVRNVNDTIREIFQLTGFDDILTIE